LAKILLMYISQISGHHRACMALENALRLLNRSIVSKSINSFNYTNPVLEKIINKTYMAVIKRRPEVWEYLYDNPVVVRKTQRLKDSIHRFNSAKMKTLLDDFKPDAVVCTQAFPCGIVADLKKSNGLNIPLIAVLTDYAPHSYWIYNDVNSYVVPSADTGRRLVENGVSEEKIKVLGIPIDPKFYTTKPKADIFNKYSLDSSKPVILIMGGGQGLGPINKLIALLDRSSADMQILAITGMNKRLYRSLARRKGSFRKKTLIMPYSESIDEIMEIATVIITKPGGITTAEALSKELPMIILNPLPGQEAMNTRYLLQRKLAIKAKDEREAVLFLEELLNNPDKLSNIKKEIRKEVNPDSSIKIGKLILGSVR